MHLTAEEARQLLAKSEAILDGHFVGTGGKHLSVYVAKDCATRFTSVVSELCRGIAEKFAYTCDDIEVVVAPAIGGIALSQWTAHWLTVLRPDLPEVLALYAEHDDEVVGERKCTAKISVENPNLFDKYFYFDLGDQLILRKAKFALKRGFDKDVQGKRVLGIEDVLTTGGSAARTVTAIRAAGGILCGFGALANGGGVTGADIGVDRLETLITVERQVFTEKECVERGLCAQGIPINTNFGHGKDFLARKQSAK